MSMCVSTAINKCFCLSLSLEQYISTTSFREAEHCTSDCTLLILIDQTSEWIPCIICGHPSLIVTSNNNLYLARKFIHQPYCYVNHCRCFINTYLFKFNSMILHNMIYCLFGFRSYLDSGGWYTNEKQHLLKADYFMSMVLGGVVDRWKELTQAKLQPHVILN